MTLLSIWIATLSSIAVINHGSMRDCLYGCINNQFVCNERIIEKNVNNDDIVVIVPLYIWIVR
jgi:hypothetical protein